MKQLIDTTSITTEKDNIKTKHVGTIISLTNRVYTIIKSSSSSKMNNKHESSNSILTNVFELVSCPTNEDTKNKKEENGDKEGESTIESCCIYMTSSLDVYCGVSRGDKSLSIYHIVLPTTTEKEETSTTAVAVKAMTVHKTVRKVCAISFNSVLQDTTTNTVCIFTADVQGDVTAYPLTSRKDNRKRLLLGHTASILTGIKIVNNNRIITCDRDEKIRISSFPNAWHIQGYLLGHTDYISSIDVTTTSAGKALCVSCSGDGTVRLWDYESYELLATYEQHTTEDDNDEAGSNNNAFSCVSIHEDGMYITTTRHSVPTIELYSVNEPTATNGSHTITLIQTIPSPVLPISLTFLPQTDDTKEVSLLVLCLQPNYLLHYQLNHQTNIFQDISTNSYYHNTISKFGELYNITMPTTNLMKSHLQGGRSITTTTIDDNNKSNDVTTAVTIPYHPWNNNDKREVVRNRTKRSKYRKRAM